MSNGVASLTTSSGEQGTKQKKEDDEKNLVTKGDEISNTKILSTLAKILWMKDNLEFKLRVLTALGFLVGAKVSVQGPAGGSIHPLLTRPKSLPFF